MIVHALVPLLLATASSATPTTTAGTVVFAGDVVAHATLVQSFESRGASTLFAPISPVIRAADVALCNLETPAVQTRSVTQSGVRFNVHENFVRAVSDAGFDAASVANNHTFDMGLAGVAGTLETFSRVGMQAAGAAPDGGNPLEPKEIPLLGKSLCLFAATRILNYPQQQTRAHDPRVALARPSVAREQNALLDAVRAHRAHCGAIVVSLHTGSEYGDRPDPGDPSFFHRVAEAGADVVIGHHSHTPHPVELMTTTRGQQVPLFYSLGNLVSNQGRDVDEDRAFVNARTGEVGRDWRTRVGLLAVMRFEAGSDAKLRLAEFGYVPVWTINSSPIEPKGSLPSISTSLLPWQGGSDAMLQRVWNDTVTRVGASYLLPPNRLPGSVEAYRLSETAAIDNRVRTAAAVTARIQQAAAAREARRQRSRNARSSSPR